MSSVPWPPPPPRRRPWVRALSACWAAWSLLTAVRLPWAPPSLDERGWARGLACYPVVGLALGVMLLWFAGMGLITLGSITLWLLAPLWALLTGALHLDGLMDTADGLMGGATPEARLRIMRDERVGAFGVVAALSVFGVKMAALGMGVPLEGLILAPVWARWAAVWAIVRYPYARDQGLGRALKNHSRPRDLLLASLAAVLISLPFDHGWLFALVAWATAVLFARAVQERVPGFTGDMYGALIELVETLILVVAHSPHLRVHWIVPQGPPWI
ncbi:MAG: adenosylcobinamide-GDP ribazoletransferase [Chloroflexi bacterium]|nr:adenosylcobinamide-GDP ribazoletransferase [Chloroflexota bacterium]